MNIDEITFYDRLLDYHNVLFLGHRNADPDAVSSAFALAEAFGGTVGVADHCGRVASMLVDHLKINVVYAPDPSDYDFTVVVDTSTQSQLNDLVLGDYAVIDHHSVSQLLSGAQFYLHRYASSTAEIVVDVLACMDAPVMERIALALMTGIITDTGHFKHAESGSFRAIADLIDRGGVSYSEALDLLAATPQDISMRISILESVNRVRTTMLDDWILVTSETDSFGAAAATALTNIGADLSFVGMMDDGILKVSGRAKHDAVRCGINLGKVMRDVGVEYHGSGGGHAGAAGMEVEVSGGAETVLSRCVEESCRILAGVSRN